MGNGKKYVVDLKLPRGNSKKTLVLNLSTEKGKDKEDCVEDKKGKKRYFFGWSNIKWLLREIMKIYSSEPSYFSKKRVESSVAFIIGQMGMLYWIMFHYQTIGISDFLLWASVEFVISGYYVTQIQKEKKDTSDTIIIEPELIVEDESTEEELPNQEEPENIE